MQVNRRQCDQRRIIGIVVAFRFDVCAVRRIVGEIRHGNAEVGWIFSARDGLVLQTVADEQRRIGIGIDFDRDRNVVALSAREQPGAIEQVVGGGSGISHVCAGRSRGINVRDNDAARNDANEIRSELIRPVVGQRKVC